LPILWSTVNGESIGLVVSGGNNASSLPKLFFDEASSLPSGTGEGGIVRLEATFGVDSSWRMLHESFVVAVATRAGAIVVEVALSISAIGISSKDSFADAVSSGCEVLAHFGLVPWKFAKGTLLHGVIDATIRLLLSNDMISSASSRILGHKTSTSFTD
jgi:hypothetical protein